MESTPAVSTNIGRAAAFASGLRHRGLPPEVLDAAKKCLADWVGVAIGARDEPAAHAVRATIAAWRAAGVSPVLFGAATTPVAAALANGTLAHCLDFDDTHVPSVAHLSSPSWAAVLAAGSAAGCDEHALLAAFVAAFEVGARLGGEGFGVAVNTTGWHSTGIFGTLAGAAGAASAMGFDAAATARTLGAAATQAGGLTGSFGTMAKPFHAGKAAMNGVLSAELVASGFVPSLQLLEPGGGLAHALVQDDSRAMPTAGFDAGWEVLQNTFKPYACCLLTHATIDAGRALAAQVAGREIARVICHINQLGVQLAGKPAPTTALEGKFSTAYCAALALSGFAATQTDFSPERIADPALRALTAKVTLAGDAAIAETAATMVVEFADGTRAGHTVAMALGNPGNPLSWDDLRAKFMPLAAPVLGPGVAGELFACLQHFEQPGSAARMWTLCGADRGAPA